MTAEFEPKRSLHAMHFSQNTKAVRHGPSPLERDVSRRNNPSEAHRRSSRTPVPFGLEAIEMKHSDGLPMVRYTEVRVIYYFHIRFVSRKCMQLSVIESS